MKNATRAVQALFILVVVAATYASASTLGGVTTRKLGAGSASVVSCDADGVNASYATSGGSVTDVTISNISAACDGGALSFTLVNSAGSKIGDGGPRTVDATSETMAVSPQPSSANVAAIHVVILGP